MWAGNSFDPEKVEENMIQQYEECNNNPHNPALNDPGKYSYGHNDSEADRTNGRRRERPRNSTRCLERGKMRVGWGVVSRELYLR